MLLGFGAPFEESSCGERRPLLDQGHDLGHDGLIRNPPQQAAAVTIPKRPVTITEMRSCPGCDRRLIVAGGAEKVPLLMRLTNLPKKTN